MIKATLLNMLLFTIFDAIWWGVIAKGFFKSQMSHLARFENGSVNIFYPSAVFVYVLMSLLLAVFVVQSASTHSAMHALWLGALLGFGLFVTFDFTNHALIENYPIRFAMVDVAWGTAMCAATSFISYKILH